MNWLHNRFDRRATAPSARRARPYRPQLEALETRDVPSITILTTPVANASVQATVGRPYVFQFSVVDTSPTATDLTASFQADPDVGAVNPAGFVIHSPHVNNGGAGIVWQFTWAPTFTSVMTNRGAALGDVSVDIADNAGTQAGVLWNVEVFPAPPAPPPPPAPPGAPLANPFAVFTFLVKRGKHWGLQVWNSDQANPFLGWLLLEGLSKKQARSLGLPNAATPQFLFLPPGGVSEIALPFTPNGSLSGFAF
jgi:hypothetical protein